MPDKQVFLTPEGHEKLQAELDFLRSVRRQEVAQLIHEAKSDGDITENFAYDQAKAEQAFVEGRILTLERMLENAVIIPSEGPRDTVCLGSYVTVVQDKGEPETFQIVGSAESDPTQGRISNESPVGRALLGRRVGEEVAVHTPGGTLFFEIVDIR